MPLSETYIVEKLIPALDSLRDGARSIERRQSSAIEAAPASHRDSARNLLHYLALRQRDISELQRDLAVLGLSRLGRAEANVMVSLEAVSYALHRLAGCAPPAAAEAGEGTETPGSAARLEAHTDALLGRPAGRRAARIMVTMPTEAAEDPGLIRDLLAAGMDVMRLNCAHDGPEAWRAMIAHLRTAERAVGRACKVYADLQGPKLRTGAIRPVGRVAEFGPQRDVWGAVVEPARLLVVPRGSRVDEFAGADAVLPVDPAIIALTREGDEMVLKDSRGSRRHITFVRREAEGWIAQAAVHIYLRDGAQCTLNRCGAVLAEGYVGPLPDTILPLVLRPGDLLEVTTEACAGSPAHYSENGALAAPASIPCTLPEAFTAVRPGQRIWFDDGKIGGVLRETFADRFVVEITHANPGGSKLRSEKGINLPETELAMPALTERDRADLRLVAPQVDMVGLSFVRRPKDVQALVAELKALNAERLGIVLKIENRLAVENLPGILLAALRSPPVGVMLARGDLAVEVGFERLAELQEEILSLCEAAHTPVIWATQVLESMAKKGRPSRAEMTDAAMSARAECVMLNKGPHIVSTVQLLHRVLARMGGQRVKRKPVLQRLTVSDLLDDNEDA